MGHQGRDPRPHWGGRRGRDAPRGRGWRPTCRESSYRRMTTRSTCVCQNPEPMTPNEPTWAAQAPTQGPSSGTPRSPGSWPRRESGQARSPPTRFCPAPVEVPGTGRVRGWRSPDGLAEQVAMTRTRVREAIARLEKIGVLVPATVPGGGRSKLYGVDWSALGHDERPQRRVRQTRPRRPLPTAPGAVRRVRSGRSVGIRQPDTGHLERRRCSGNSLFSTGGGDRPPGVTAQVSTRWLADMGLLLQRSDRHRGSATDARPRWRR